MARLDLGNAVVEAGAGVVGGGLQRLAWEAGQMPGLIATGAMILGGVAIQAMVDQPLIRQLGQAASISGATVAGWVATEKYMISGTPRTPLAAQHQRAVLEAQRRSLSRDGADSRISRNALVMVEDAERTVL